MDIQIFKVIYLLLNFLNYLKKCKLKWQTKFLTLLSQFAFKFIVGPPPPLLKDLPKIESLWGGYKIFCQKGVINLKRGLDVEKGGCHYFYYFTAQSHLLCVGGRYVSIYYFSDLQSFELAMHNSHPSLYCTNS